MMTAPASVVSYLGSLSGTPSFRADLYTLTLASGSILYWTNCDRDILYGGKLYLANGAVQRRSNIRKTSRLDVDTLNIELSAVCPLNTASLASGLAYPLATIPLGLAAAQGAFYGGRLQLDHLLGPSYAQAIAWGPIKGWYEGRIAGTSLSGNIVRMAVESDVAALARTVIPRFRYDLMCGHAVYDANCALVKASFTDAATATGGTTLSITSTTAAVIARATDYYKLGVLKFTSGLLANQRQAVKAFSVSAGVATISLQLPFSAAPTAGDAFNIYPGCDRTLATCVDKFANLVHFLGFPHVPVPEGAT